RHARSRPRRGEHAAGRGRRGGGAARPRRRRDHAELGRTRGAHRRRDADHRLRRRRPRRRGILRARVRHRPRGRAAPGRVAARRAALARPVGLPARPLPFLTLHPREDSMTRWRTVVTVAALLAWTSAACAQTELVVAGYGGSFETIFKQKLAPGFEK